eukprot:1158140-Pelagomonas_calceolata.AAC.12
MRQWAASWKCAYVLANMVHRTDAHAHTDAMRKVLRCVLVLVRTTPCKGTQDYAHPRMHCGSVAAGIEYGIILA